MKYTQTELWTLAREIDSNLGDRYAQIDEIAFANQIKVLDAFRKVRVTTQCLTGTTGYGYDDVGRETLDRLYAFIFRTESALVRWQMVSGTHALATCLFGITRPGDEILSLTGDPYDTLKEVFGIRPATGSLREWGVGFSVLPSTAWDRNEGLVNVSQIAKHVNSNTRVAYIQRSRGYTGRSSLSVESIGKLIEAVKSVNPDIICVVDNCYGEFVEKMEPSEVGADVVIGSLTKNPGGGYALTGGYIAGTARIIDQCASRLIAPGIGAEVGASLEGNLRMFQGLFVAPHVVAEALKGSLFAAAFWERLGFPVSPTTEEARGDIIQSVTLGSGDKLKAFCRGLQNASPVDSHLTPEPWDMPGYDVQVIMAAGTFVQGASIELTADGSYKPPYRVFLQGGLMKDHVVIAMIFAADQVLRLD